MSIAKPVIPFLSLLSFALVAGAPRAASAQELIPVSKVTVTAARPGKADTARLRKFLDLGTLSDQDIENQHPVYIVKVFARFAPGPAEVGLTIGDTKFPMYGLFGKGVFVRLYGAEKVQALTGQPVKLVRKGPKGEEPTVDSTTLLEFPALPSGARAVVGAPSVPEAAGAVAARKTVREVLGED